MAALLAGYSRLHCWSSCTVRQMVFCTLSQVLVCLLYCWPDSVKPISALMRTVWTLHEAIQKGRNVSLILSLWGRTSNWKAV